ncbi:hypothetical protein HHK36_027126 [Tetracentron sinense]|uniref:Uncharacterized protein n=1 Tax=Tetracentron sinense TaxID=13715 RepID=A0A834YGA7_TETSI|nr:hypothetical protein HHK36_027126 [Tetracentron sinense]
MADRSSAVARPVWMKQAEEAKLKSDAEKTATAKAAFEATFKDVGKNVEREPASDSDAEEAGDLENKPIGPVDPAKCTAAGAGIAGGAACSPSSFVVVTKDSDGRKIPNGGAQLKVKISPGVGVGGSEQEGMVKDQGDGTYTVTYVVPKRGNYMVHVECNGQPIMGSAFPVFFGAGTTGGLLGMPSTGPFPNHVNQTMPNMPNYSGSVSGAFPGLLGMIPGILPGASGGAILPGIGASFGEVCGEYLNGRCAKTDCKFNHPPHNLLMTALAATSTMGTLSQVPMAPSAAAMAAAQAIVAAQALQAHAAQMQAQAQSTRDSSVVESKNAGTHAEKAEYIELEEISENDVYSRVQNNLETVIPRVELVTIQVEQAAPQVEQGTPMIENFLPFNSALLSGSLEKTGNADALKRTLQISNLSPLLTVEQLKQLFRYCGTVVECSITDSKHFAYIEYSKPEEAAAALALNNIDVGGRPLNVEMAKVLPPKPAFLTSSMASSSLPMVMQQAVAMQQMQFQQAIHMQQTMFLQQTANRAAIMKSATEMASSRAAEISKKLKADGVGTDEKETNQKSRSPSALRLRSKSKSRSPVKYRHSRRSQSFSPPIRHTRDRRSRSPLRYRHHTNYGRDRRSYKDIRDSNDRAEKRDRERSRDRYSSFSRRNRSRSVSPRARKSSRAGSASPKRRRESVSPRTRKSSRANSRSPRHHRGSMSSPRSTHQNTLNHRGCSRSDSAEGRPHSDDRKDRSRSEKAKLDGRKPDKNDNSFEEPNFSAKDSRNMREDWTLDSSATTHKKSSLLLDGNLEDGRDGGQHKKSRLDHRDSLKAEAAVKGQYHDENNSISEDKQSLRSPVLMSHKRSLASVDERTHSSIKDLSKYEKSSEHKKYEKTISSRRERDTFEKDRTRTGTEDLSRHGKLISDQRRHEKVDSVRREKDFDDSTYSREGRRVTEYSDSKYHKSSSKHPGDSLFRGTKDRHRSERSKLEGMKTEKTANFKKEVISADYDLSDRSEDRIIGSPKLRTLKRASSIEDLTYSDPENLLKNEKLILNNRKLEITDPITKKEGYIDEVLEGVGEDGSVACSSKLMTHVGSPRDDGTSLSTRELNIHEQVNLEKRKLDESGFIGNRSGHESTNLDSDGWLDSMGLIEEGLILHSVKQGTQKRSLSLDDKPSTDANNMSRDEKSIMGYSEFDKIKDEEYLECDALPRKISSGTNKQDYKLEASIEDVNNVYSPDYAYSFNAEKLGRHELLDMDYKELEGSDYVITNQETAYFLEMTKRSSTQDSLWSRGVEDLDGREKSTQEDKNIEKTGLSKDQDYTSDDLEDMIEDMRSADPPMLKAHKRNSMSPEVDSSRVPGNTEDLNRHKKPKLDHGVL